MDTEFQFGKMKYSERDGGDACTATGRYLILLKLHT